MTLGSYAAVRVLVRALASKGIFDDADLRQIVRDLLAEAELATPEAKLLNQETLLLSEVVRLEELAGAIIEDLEKARGSIIRGRPGLEGR